jgi:urease accessory protein
MRAAAWLTVERASDAGKSRITRLHSEAPLILRPTHPVGPTPLESWHWQFARPVHVSLAAGAAGPIGGDDLRLDVDVGAGASLVLRTVAATLVLPGPHGQPSRTVTTVRVAAGGVLIWLPEPVIAAHRCHHAAFTQVLLEPGARLLLREELLLGRHGEQPGRIRQRLRVCLGDCPLHDQEIALGPGAPGCDGPVVAGGRHALGSALLVAPGWNLDGMTTPAPLGGTDTALLPLSGPAALVAALAPDALALRHQLDEGIRALEACLPSSESPG